MKRIIAVATILGLSAFAAFAQRGAGRGMGRPAGMPPAGAQNMQTKAPHQGMPAGAQGGMAAGGQHQPGVKLNPALTERLQPLVPAGMTIEDAAAGFRNTGQFVSALHVSQNLNIPFDQLKTAMTGPDAVSLGKAIQQLKPDMTKQEVNTAVKTAQTQAREQERARNQQHTQQPTGQQTQTQQQTQQHDQTGKTSTTSKKK